MPPLAGAQVTPTMSTKWSPPKAAPLESIVDGVNSHHSDFELESRLSAHSDNYDYTPWIQLDLHSPKEVHEVRTLRTKVFVGRTCSAWGKC